MAYRLGPQLLRGEPGAGAIVQLANINIPAVAQAIQPPAADQPEPVRPEDYTVDKPSKSKKTARALAEDLVSMDMLVDVLNRKKLLSADEVEFCKRVMARGDAFRVGIEYGEALKNA